MKYQKLKKELAKQNLTVLKLSYLTNIAAPDLYNAINGKKPFYPGWKKRVAAALGKTINDLFEAESKSRKREVKTK